MHREIYLICDRIRSLYNVGSLFRSADAFGVDKLYLCGYTGAPPRQEIAKVALGAEEIVPWEKKGQAWKVVEELQSRGVYVVALENNVAQAFRPDIKAKALSYRKSIPLHKFRPRFPLALIVGNEVNGISAGVLCRANAVVHIPMLGAKESLNVSVAAGVALYAIRYRV